MACVYKITNKLNQKWYIGSHYNDDLSDGYMGSGIALNAAINKYGKDSFMVEILHTGLSRQVAYDIEGGLLVSLNAEKDVMSYNLKNIARGGITFQREESRRKISETMTGIPKPKEVVEKFAATQRGMKKSRELVISNIRGHIVGLYYTPFGVYYGINDWNNRGPKNISSYKFHTNCKTGVPGWGFRKKELIENFEGVLNNMIML